MLEPELKTAVYSNLALAQTLIGLLLLSLVGFEAALVTVISAVPIALVAVSHSFNS